MKISVSDIVAGHAGEYSAARVRVVMPRAIGGRWQYCRFGFTFGQEPVELAMDQLGASSVEIAEVIVRLADDKFADEAQPILSALLVLPDGSEQQIGEVDVAELRAFARQQPAADAEPKASMVVELPEAIDLGDGVTGKALKFTGPLAVIAQKIIRLAEANAAELVFQSADGTETAIGERELRALRTIASAA